MAAITATIALSSASCTVGQSIMATVAITNPNASAVTITEIKPTCIETGNTEARDGSSFSAANVPLGNGLNATVSANSSANFLFSISPYAPSRKQDDSGTNTYDVSCHISSNLGDYIAPTAATLTVHPVLPVF